MRFDERNHDFWPAMGGMILFLVAIWLVMFIVKMIFGG